MVHVSDKKLQKETLKKIEHRFVDGLTKIKKVSITSSFLNELLGEEERLMLAKRLAVIYMLVEEISPYRIAHVLGLSTSTVNKMQKTHDLNGYATIASLYTEKKNHKVCWDDIELLLRLGMPQYGGGKNKWKFLDDLQKKYE